MPWTIEFSCNQLNFHGASAIIIISPVSGVYFFFPQDILYKKAILNFVGPTPLLLDPSIKRSRAAPSELPFLSASRTAYRCESIKYRMPRPIAFNFSPKNCCLIYAIRVGPRRTHSGRPASKIALRYARNYIYYNFGKVIRMSGNSPRRDKEKAKGKTWKT